MSDHPIYALSDELFEAWYDLDPEDATYAGVPGRDDRWADRSPDGLAARLDVLRSFRRRIEQLPIGETKWERLAAEVLQSELSHDIVRLESGEAHRDLNRTWSPFQEYRRIFDQAPRDGDASWAAIATRLETLDDALEGYAASLDEANSRGDRVAKRQLRGVIEQARANAADDSPLSDLVGEYGSGPLEARLEDAVVAGRRAFSEFGDHVEQHLLPDGADQDGVGEERYRPAAHYFLGTDLDLRAAYDWGWSAVAETLDRMKTTAEQIAPGQDVASVIELLQTDPNRAAGSQDEFVEFVQARTDEALERLAGDHFDVPPQILQCDVRMAPPSAPLGAYYVPPSEDFTRPGAVWFAMGADDRPIPLYDQVTTTYHEGFPGHHLQSGTQLAVGDKLTKFHRVKIWKSGSGEGWALYAERLMDELGYLDSSDYVFGFLTARMLRACRVVIDIGSHLGLPIPEDQSFHPGENWTFDIGVEMLERYAALAPANARSEMNRYLGWPGQAIAYLLGEREILTLREDARRQLGDGYADKDFHARVLEVGSIDIDLIRKFALEA